MINVHKLAWKGLCMSQCHTEIIPEDFQIVFFLPGAKYHTKYQIGKFAWPILLKPL